MDDNVGGKKSSKATYREYPHKRKNTLALGLVAGLLDKLELLLDILLKHTN
jgi:hypothetical protein